MTGSPGGIDDDAFVSPPEHGRIFEASRPVRFGDVTPGRRLRLDALAAHLQDVAADDQADAGAPHLVWVVRRTHLRVFGFPRAGQRVTLATWCGGAGSRWAERRTDVSVGGDLAICAAALWVHLDSDTARPARLPEVFHEVWASAAGGRRVSARLHHPGPAGGVRRVPWPLRAVDVDALGHVNNTLAWAAVEEELVRRPELSAPFDAVVEYASAIDLADRVDRAAEDRPGGFATWLLVGDEARATAVVQSASHRPGGVAPEQP